jgi:hypothetical protein
MHRVHVHLNAALLYDFAVTKKSHSQVRAAGAGTDAPWVGDHESCRTRLVAGFVSGSLFFSSPMRQDKVLSLRRLVNCHDPATTAVWR